MDKCHSVYVVGILGFDNEYNFKNNKKFNIFSFKLFFWYFFTKTLIKMLATF